MMSCHANKCIACTVQQCAYHCEDADYCSLESILVGTHEMNPVDRLQVLPPEVMTDERSGNRRCAFFYT